MTDFEFLKQFQMFLKYFCIFMTFPKNLTNFLLFLIKRKIYKAFYGQLKGLNKRCMVSTEILLGLITICMVSTECFYVL